MVTDEWIPSGRRPPAVVNNGLHLKEEESHPRDPETPWELVIGKNGLIFMFKM
jgi:hypothetical protein